MSVMMMGIDGWYIPVSGGTTPTTWDPLHTDSGTTLDVTNLVATNNGTAGPPSGTRSVDSFSGTTKIYLETVWTVYPGTAGSANMSVGVANSTWAPSQDPIGTDNAAAYRDDGGFWLSFGHISGMGTSGLNDRIGLAADFGNKKLWVRVNGGNWNGAAIGSQNPATNTGGFDVSAMNPGAWFIQVFSSVNTYQSTTKFSSASWIDTAPAGFIQLGH